MGVFNRVVCGQVLFGSLLMTASMVRADPQPGQVVVGPARFTVITPQCIRIEYDASGKFVDDPSYFAANRTARWAGAKIAGDAKSLTIDTGEIQLTYRPDGQPFSPENLEATIHKGTGQINGIVEWHPGLPNAGNLGGTERTLDGWTGARKLSDGVLSRDGWYLLDDSKTVLLTSDWVKARPDTAGSDWYLFGYGDDYKSALQSLTTIGGPVPLPRRYMLGAWYSRYWPYSSQEFRQLVQEYAEHKFPLDVLVLDMDWHLDGWTGYTWNPKLLADHQNLLDWLHAKGLAVTLNDHPADGVKPHEAAYPDFMKAMGLNPAKDKPLPFDAGDQKYLSTFYAATHRPLEKQGVDFWWLDWQQFPFTRSIASLTNLAWLNDYYYAQTSADGRRGASFSRWAGWGDHRHPIHFSGDANTGFPMLAAEVPFTSTAGNVGCFFWSHDIGGHMGGRNEESYTRWCQFGAFSAALRSHSTRDKTMDRRPWSYADWAEASMQTSFQLRSQFFPYTYSAVQQACEDSVPFIRPMYLDHPTKEAAYHQPQQYLFSDNVLVAPVTEPGAGPNKLGRQTVWFPQGTWFNYFTNERFVGEQQKLVAATIDEFPLYIRGGVPIPMRAVTQRMATDPLNELVIRCYPGADGQTTSTTLREDDGLSTDYRKGATAETLLTYARAGDQITVTIAPTKGDFAGQVQSRSYVIELPATQKPGKVLIDGTPATADYAEAESLARVTVAARSIRQGCVVTVTADDVDPETFKLRAFARRAGIDAPTADVKFADLLSTALDKAQNKPHAAAISAAAGVGLFGRNENVYGYPAQNTIETFGDDTPGVQVKSVESDDNALNAKRTIGFDITVNGRTFAAGGQTGDWVDWSAKPGNIATSATVTVSSGGPVRALVDGSPAGYPGADEHEWASRKETNGAWAKLEWTLPQTIDRIVLFDRPNPADQVLAGRIDFSDGTNATFDTLQNDGLRGTEIKFSAKTVSWIKITLTKVSDKTVNSGLSEIAVFVAK